MPSFAMLGASLSTSPERTSSVPSASASSESQPPETIPEKSETPAQSKEITRSISDDIEVETLELDDELECSFL
jgi:hypothetical protein